MKLVAANARKVRTKAIAKQESRLMQLRSRQLSWEQISRKLRLKLGIGPCLPMSSTVRHELGCVGLEKSDQSAQHGPAHMGLGCAGPQGNAYLFSSSGLPLPAPSSLPSPKWINPYLDVSDLAHRHPSDPPLLPSPWLTRIISLVLDPLSPFPRASLDAFCRHFLLRLPPAFISVALRYPDLHCCPISALRFFHWAIR